MNLPTLPVTGKGSQTGRVLLRRSGTVPPLPWSTFAPPLTYIETDGEQGVQPPDWVFQMIDDINMFHSAPVGSAESNEAGARLVENLTG